MSDRGKGLSLNVRLLVHLEVVPGGDPAFVWWAESDEVPGFSAAADHLPDLMKQAVDALGDILGEDVTIDAVLATPAPAEREPVEVSGSGAQPTTSGVPTLQVVLSAA